MKGEIPPPFAAVRTLIEEYLGEMESDSPILDVGCETGKHALPLIVTGEKVVLMDIAPNAIECTQENLKKKGRLGGVAGTISGKIEELDPKWGPFKAVVGGYVFSFVPRRRFEKMMRENVLGRIEPRGFFAGGFFGKEHAWAVNSQLCCVGEEELEALFGAAGFEICAIAENRKMEETVLDGEQCFHTIELVARRRG